MARRRLRQTASQYLERPLARLLARLHLHPNAITLAGLLLSGGVGYLLSQGWFLAGGLLLLLAGLMDMLDGALARLTGAASTTGALIDSVADRLSEAAVFLGLLWFYSLEGNTGAVVATYAALTFSFMVSYLRARAESLGESGEVGLATRPERVVLLIVGLVLGSLVAREAVTVTLWVLAALAALTAGQRLLHFLRRSR